MRMFGTLIGTLVALVFIALFAQERWLFMVSLSMWVGFCTYMMGGSKRQYFWHVCGFVSAIICMDAGPDPINAFNIAILRSQETGLGILVYSLVAFLLWPSNSRGAFDAAVADLASTHRQLFQLYFALMNGAGKVADAQALRAQVMQAQTRFNQLLDAAQADSYEVWELRRQWRRYQQQVAKLAETMEHWREGFVDLRGLSLNALLPDLPAFGAELERRFAEGEQMLAGRVVGQAAEQVPVAMDLALEETRVRTLPPFQLAALAVTRNRLQSIDALSEHLLECIRDIRGIGPAAAAGGAAPPRARFLPDPDRLISVVRIMLIMWLAYLALIYVGDLPGGSGVVSFACAIGMILAATRQLAASQLFTAGVFSTLFAGVVYIFVMPQLSSFIGLGLLLFATTFAICYLFAAPQQALGRVFGLAMFVTVASISNEQSYSFLVVANTAMMFPVVFAILVITAYVPFSPRPELALLRLLRRFFRSSAFLASALQWQPRQARRWHNRWRRLFHSREVLSLPNKLGAWARGIDSKALPGTSSGQVQALVSSVQSLSNRMSGLSEAHGRTHTPLLARELLQDISDWHRLLTKTCERLSVDPAAAEREAFRNALDEVLQHIESRMRQAMDELGEGRLSVDDGESFYRLLGSFRSVSEALVDYAGSADVIDWARWREERFA